MTKPEAEQVEAVAEAMQREWNDFVMDTGCYPDLIEVNRRKVTADFICSIFGKRLATVAIKASGAEHIAIVAGLLKNIIDDEFTEHLFEAKETAKQALSYIPPELRGK